MKFFHLIIYLNVSIILSNEVIHALDIGNIDSITKTVTDVDLKNVLSAFDVIVNSIKNIDLKNISGFESIAESVSKINFKKIFSTIDSIAKAITNIHVSKITGYLTKGLKLISKYQCTSNCEDIHLPFSTIVKKYGYPVEEHDVKTSDEYLLTTFRIPNESGPAVLLIHGIVWSAYDFVTIGPQAGLAYQLADAGYDVWIANCRGTKDSMRHVSLSTDSAAFWDFSWDEIGLYDIPAMIDYILKAKNAKDLKVIAHSYGTNAIVTLVSEKSEYNDKISVITLLSPTIFEKNTKSPLLKLLSAPIAPDFNKLAKAIGFSSAFADADVGPIINVLKDVLCSTQETASTICHNVIFILYGSNYGQVNETSLPVIYGHFPASTSIKGFQHYFQIAKSGKFSRYDCGEKLNLKKYGSSDPPEIRLDNITTKVAIYWSEDTFCSEEDVQILLNKLQNVIKVEKVPFSSHVDYVFARDVKPLLYDKVLELLKSN